MLALPLTAFFLQVQNLKSQERVCPHVFVTTSGEWITSLDPPNHDGKPVRFRACPAGTLTMIPASQIDWPATEEAERPGASPTPTPAPAPTKASLSTLAKGRNLLEADEAVQRNQTLSGKMKVGDKEYTLGGSFFGKESVARHLRLGTFVADTSGCPVTRARAYGTVKNVSTVKLRRLRALVVVGSLGSGDYNGQVQSMDPSDLVPGEEAEIHLWLSCDWTTRTSNQLRAYRSTQEIVVVLPDIAGVVEEMTRPDGSNPFETPTPAKVSAPARTPTPRAR